MKKEDVKVGDTVLLVDDIPTGSISGCYVRGQQSEMMSGLEFTISKMNDAEFQVLLTSELRGEGDSESAWSLPYSAIHSIVPEKKPLRYKAGDTVVVLGDLQEDSGEGGGTQVTSDMIRLFKGKTLVIKRKYTRIDGKKEYQLEGYYKSETIGDDCINHEATEKLKTPMFRQDEYIVLTDELDRRRGTFKTDHCYKQRKDSEHLQVYVDSENDQYSCSSYRADGSCKTWRYATDKEVEEYDRLGKPYDVTTLKSSPKKVDSFKVGDKVKIIGNEFDSCHSIGSVGIIDEIDITDETCSIEIDEVGGSSDRGTWSKLYDVELVTKAEFVKKEFIKGEWYTCSCNENFYQFDKLTADREGMSSLKIINPKEGEVDGVKPYSTSEGKNFHLLSLFDPEKLADMNVVNKYLEESNPVEQWAKGGYFVVTEDKLSSRDTLHVTKGKVYEVESVAGSKLVHFNTDNGSEHNFFYDIESNAKFFFTKHKAEEFSASLVAAKPHSTHEWEVGYYTVHEEDHPVYEIRKGDIDEVNSVERDAVWFKKFNSYHPGLDSLLKIFKTFSEAKKHARSLLIEGCKFKIGDQVKLMRKADGLRCHWMREMNQHIEKTGEVVAISENGNLGTSFTTLYISPDAFDLYEEETEAKPSSEIMDLSGTKIWIGKNPDLCIQVQNKLFEAGCEWHAGGANVQCTHATEIYIDKNFEFGYESDESSEHFDTHSNREITPIDLGIKKVVMKESDLISYPQTYAEAEPTTARGPEKGEALPFEVKEVYVPRSMK